MHSQFTGERYAKNKGVNLELGAYSEAKMKCARRKTEKKLIFFATG